MVEIFLVFYVIVCIFVFGRLVRFGVIGEVVFYLVVGGGVALYVVNKYFSNDDGFVRIYIGYFLIALIMAIGCKCLVYVYFSELDDEAKKYRESDRNKY